jgi:hypothetical protein
MAHVLEYPSLTVQWLPVRAWCAAASAGSDAPGATQDVVEPGGADYKAQRLLLGTQADAGEQNYLLIAEAKARGSAQSALPATVPCTYSSSR